MRMPIIAAVSSALLCAGHAPAYAEGDPTDSYVTEHGAEVCDFIRAEPNVVGVRHAVDHILATSGEPVDQTGRLLGASVRTYCPEQGLPVQEFVWFIRNHQQNGGSLGGSAIAGL